MTCQNDQPAKKHIEGRASLDALVIPTRNRPNELHRCLESHLSHFRLHDRKVVCHILDSSDDRGCAEATREQVTKLRRSWKSEVRYAGIYEKLRFSDYLSAETGIERRLARFALTDLHGCGHDTGSNRNALLLGLTGKMFLSSDDDVVCCPHGYPSSDRLQLSSSGDPTSVRVFDSFASAKAAVRETDGCLLSQHERLLGLPLSNVLRQVAQPKVTIKSMDSRFRRAAVEGKGKIAATSSGVVGDCGARYPSFYLWESDELGAYLSRQDHETYRRIVLSRQIVRLAAHTTVSSAPFLMSTHFALDARDILPPFMPVLRGQDLTFARILMLLRDRDCIGHIPTGILHEPMVRRVSSIDTLWPNIPGASFGEFFNACLSAAAAAVGFEQTGDSRRICVLGQELTEIASMNREELEVSIGPRLRAANATRLQRLKLRLERFADDKAQWVLDLKSMIERRSVNLSKCEPLRFAGMDFAGDQEHRLILTRRLVSDFGKLLQNWPALVDASLYLRGRNKGLFGDEC